MRSKAAVASRRGGAPVRPSGVADAVDGEAGVRRVEEEGEQLEQRRVAAAALEEQVRLLVLDGRVVAPPPGAAQPVPRQRLQARTCSRAGCGWDAHLTACPVVMQQVRARVEVVWPHPHPVGAAHGAAAARRPLTSAIIICPLRMVQPHPTSPNSSSGPAAAHSAHTSAEVCRLPPLLGPHAVARAAAARRCARPPAKHARTAALLTQGREVAAVGAPDARAEVAQ